MPSGGVFNIAGNLGFEGFDGIEALLLAEAEKEIDDDGFFVEGGEALDA